MPLAVRPARPDDQAVPELLYLSSAPYYDAFAGSAERARTLLAQLYPCRGHTASHEVCHVAEMDGALLGVMACFPASAADRLGRRFLRLALPRIPPAAWPGLLRHMRASWGVSPPPPGGSLYVDALAVRPEARRRGVARALLATADELARSAGAGVVALDTGLENAAAQAVYESLGFRRTARHQARSARAARAIGGIGFVSYDRPAPVSAASRPAP